MGLTEHQSSRRQTLIGAGIGLACSVLLSAAYLAGLFAAFDERLLDWRFRMRGERDASGHVAIVSVDDATIRAYGGWPLPRDQYALLLTALEAFGARAVGVDLQLPEDVNHDPRANALLAYVSGQDPKVVHAISFLPDEASSPGAPRASSGALEALRRKGEPCVIPEITVATRVTLPYDQLLEETRALGHITVMSDHDGAVRREPLLVRFEDRAYPALGLQMIGVGRGHEGPPRVTVRGRRARIGWGPGAEWDLSLGPDGATSIDFAGYRRAFPGAYSMIDVLHGYQAGDLARWRGRLSGKYVLVGLDSRTEVTDDVGATPFSATTSLVFIHANVVENLLRHRFLTRPEPLVYVGALAILGIVLGWLFCVLPLTAAAIVTGAVLLVFAVLDFLLLAVSSVDVPPLGALLVAPVAYAAVASGRHLFLEARVRRREEDLREGRSIEQQFLPEALIGKNLSRYRIEEKLGRGGMGVVYRARDPRLDRDVALKVLSGGALADERARRRFRREALALSKLNHPRIAGVLDFDSQDGTDFLVMEFVPGTPLSARVARGSLPEVDVVRVTMAVAEALAEAHRRGIVHRDLKPDNIMLGENGDVKVLDFGLALFMRSSSAGAVGTATLTRDGHMVGTLPYMAPEVLRGLTAGPRSDLYSLGVLTFEMATGRRPFPDDEPHELLYTILQQSPAPPRIVNGRISKPLEEIILRLLAKDPADRFGSAAELLESVRSIGSPCRTEGLQVP